MNRDYDKAKDVYDRAMEEVFARVDIAKDYLQQLSVELEDTNFSEQEWEKVDRLLSKSIMELDSI